MDYRAKDEQCTVSYELLNIPLRSRSSEPGGAHRTLDQEGGTDPSCNIRNAKALV